MCSFLQNRKNIRKTFCLPQLEAKLRQFEGHKVCFQQHGLKKACFHIFLGHPIRGCDCTERRNFVMWLAKVDFSYILYDPKQYVPCTLSYLAILAKIKIKINHTKKP